jgi:hypothetical protein
MVESLPTLSWATNPALIVVVVVLVTYVVAKTWK